MYNLLHPFSYIVDIVISLIDILQILISNLFSLRNEG